MSEIVVGIDFGTTNCALALFRGSEGKFEEEPDIFDISSISPTRLLSSVVGFKKSAPKPDIGRTVLRQRQYYDDIITNFKLDMDQGNTKKYTLSSGVEKSPIEIATEIFTKIKEAIDSTFPPGEVSLKRTVITVPAIFDEVAKKNILKSARAGGFNIDVDDLACYSIEEPVAASVTFRNYGELKTGDLYIIFDFGGGTLDINLFKKVEKGIQTIETGGCELGGKDFDNAICTWVKDEFKKKHRYDLNNLEELYRDLGESFAKKLLVELETLCELAKETLTDSESYNLIHYTGLNGKNIELNLTRANFEKNIANDLIDIVERECQKIKESAAKKIDISRISKIILVGGASQMPFVTTTVEKVFESIAWKSSRFKDPQFCVAVGAAIQAKKGDVDRVIIVEPIKVPDELEKDISIRAFNADSLDEIIVPGLISGKPIPITKTEVDIAFTTEKDNQTTIEFDILYGDRKIGEIKFSGFEEMEKGVPTFFIDLEVTKDNELKIYCREIRTDWDDNKTIPIG